MTEIIYTVTISSYGTKYWCVNGKLHKVNGPAIEWTTGYKEWWLNGKRYD